MKPYYDLNRGERGNFYNADDVHVMPQESALLQKISQSLSHIKWERYRELVGERQVEALAIEEQGELIALSNQIEEANADRIEYVAELAEVRKTTLTALMKELGLKPVAHLR